MSARPDHPDTTIQFGDDSIAVSEAQIEKLLAVSPTDVTAPETLTVAKNVFLPLTTACRYTCTYCTFFDPPGEASLLTMEEIQNVLQTGADAGCTEALFTFGDTPDDRYTGIHQQLDAWGYDSIHDYLYWACEVAMAEGLLPHSNPGDLTVDQMKPLTEVNASIGVMLETTADIDAHVGSRQKSPEQRLQTIRAAGELAVPFTTGILVGIGETWRDRAISLLAIKALHERYGHVQELIVQNVVPNERSNFESPSVETMRRVTAMARYALPDTVEVQVPPNLSSIDDLLDCGIGDLGGVSPVTDDHINPNYEWPELRRLEELMASAGKTLVERLPVYDRYLAGDVETVAKRGDDPTWVSREIREAIAAHNHLRRYVPEHVDLMRTSRQSSQNSTHRPH